MKDEDEEANQLRFHEQGIIIGAKYLKFLFFQEATLSIKRHTHTHTKSVKLIVLAKYDLTDRFKCLKFPSLLFFFFLELNC